MGVSYIGLPDGVQIEGVHNLSRAAVESFWGLYTTFLRTTRERQVDDAVSDWKRNNQRKTIPSTERRILEARPVPTSLFDCMYRLRIRSNYVDADAFLLSLDDDQDAKAFNKSVRVICYYTLLVLELQIAKRIGKNRYRGVVEAFTHNAQGRVNEVLPEHRYRLLAERL